MIRTWSIRTHLLVLVAAFGLPLFAFSATVLVAFHNEQRAIVESRLVERARSLSFSVDRELLAVMRALEVLATSGALEQGDLAQFHEEAAQAIKAHEEWDVISLVDAAGKMVINTRVPYGTPIPTPAVSKMVSDVFAFVRPQVSDLFTGTLVKQPLLAAAVPVMDGERVKYSLALGMNPAFLTGILLDQHLPEGWLAAILDRNQAIIARSRDVDTYLGMTGSAAFAAKSREGGEGYFMDTTLDGIPVAAGYHRSRLTGWTAGVSVPVALLEAPLKRALALLAGGGAMLLLLGAALASWLGRRVTASFQSLFQLVDDITGGTVPAVTPLPVRETNELARSFREAGERRIEAEKALRESEARLRNVLDNMFPFVGLLSLDGRILEANRAPIEAAGLAREDVIGKPCAETWWFAYSPEVQERLREALRRAAAGEVVRYDEMIRVAGGRFITIDLMFSPIRDTEGRIHAIVGSATDITERRRTEDALRDLSRRLLEVEEAERRRINRELHDRVGQNISALGLNLGLLRARLPPEASGAIGTRLEDMEGLIETISRDIRDIMAELRPPALDDYGLLAALRAQAGALSGRLRIPIRVSGTEPSPRPPIETETALFRIAQEALNNVAKHARATRVDVSLTPEPGKLILVVADDGVGFEPDLRAPTTSWGMSTMRERAQAIGAWLRVESAPGAGTRVVVEAGVPRNGGRAGGTGSRP
jgi:PAS domain S-box-containing protein